jgi:DNA-binding GntR family transcriptional regulator
VTDTPPPDTPPAERPAPRARRARQSITERVYQRLRAEILSCALEPGQEVSEAELAARFEVSKTPIREALVTLRNDGFVRTYPRRGYQIMPITVGDMTEMFDARNIIEVGAAELACQRMTETELDNLQRLVDIEYATTETSLKKFIAGNRTFHMAIAAGSHNHRIANLVERQLDEMDRVFYLGARLRDLGSETSQHHQMIVDALRSRDVQNTRQVMLDHNDATRRGIFESMSLTRSRDTIAL